MCEGDSKLKKIKGILLLVISIMMLAACSVGNAEEGKVVIYTNSDEAASEAMKAALDVAGYEKQYVLQSLGTSEIGGKLMVEGDKIEADILTMSSYFVESAQKEHEMFADLTFETNALEQHPNYYAPVLANTGAIFANTEVLKDKGLPMPTSIKDLAKPEFKGLVSIPNIMDSSTGWLFVQAIMSEYGEVEGKTVLRNLIANTGPHLESSGSGPIKKVQAGEVAAGFGLRYQAVLAKDSGLPIEYIDPIEGNFSLTETVAVVDKYDETTKLAMEMAEVIVKDARKELITHYPVALYEGETVSDTNKPAYSKHFKQPLTVELLQQHQDFFKSAN